jgi:hypothetical protein
MEKKMRNIFVVLIVVLAASVALADGPTVAFKYVDDSGVVSFTDEEKRVPVKYKDRAEKITLGGLGDYERFTAITVASTPRVVSAPVTVQAPTKADCGTVTFRSERRDHDGFNSRFYIAEDDCGILYDAPFYPDFIVRR